MLGKESMAVNIFAIDGTDNGSTWFHNNIQLAKCPNRCSDRLPAVVKDA